MSYRVVIHEKSVSKAKAYLRELRHGARPGGRLLARLANENLDKLSVEAFLEALVNTKPPMIFAESAVVGDGSDWNRHELSILGDIGFAVPVTVFDDGRHASPVVHEEPFAAHLLFSPGALLRSSSGTPCDWDEVVSGDAIDSEGYFRLYERRLLPLLKYADRIAEQNGRKAFVTIPGMGCGQFAGRFQGRLGNELKQTLYRLLEKHGEVLPNIKAVYFDPYGECRNERRLIKGIDVLVRPLLQGNQAKPQLCRPSHYEEAGDDYAECLLFSFVAWDHVSWPGNDFYGGARATDDGVKAAATDSMQTMTGFAGGYDCRTHCFLPPSGYSTWEDVVRRNRLTLRVQGQLERYP
jgi:hypothetical protein